MAKENGPAQLEKLYGKGQWSVRSRWRTMKTVTKMREREIRTKNQNGSASKGEKKNKHRSKGDFKGSHRLNTL